MPAGGKGTSRGKLKAVARRWIGGRGGDEPRSPDALTAAAPLPPRAPTTDDDLELSPSEADAVALFFALGTQWRFHPVVGSRLGFINEAIRPTAELAEIAVTPRLLRDLQTMEAEVLAAEARA